MLNQSGEQEQNSKCDTIEKEEKTDTLQLPNPHQTDKLTNQYNPVNDTMKEDLESQLLKLNLEPESDNFKATICATTAYEGDNDHEGDHECYYRDSKEWNEGWYKADTYDAEGNYIREDREGNYHDQFPSLYEQQQSDDSSSSTNNSTSVNQMHQNLSHQRSSDYPDFRRQNSNRLFLNN